MQSIRRYNLVQTLLSCALLCGLLEARAHAQTRIQVTPMITVSEAYDDNIDLTKTQKKSDYIATVTPGASLAVEAEKTNLFVSYYPSFVRYVDYDENNTTRHSAGLSFGYALTKYLKFNLTDAYLKSDDPLEDPQNLQGIRQTRNKYWTNATDANFSYLFGAGSRVNVGYRYNIYENDQATLDDSKIQTPYANLTFWFNVQNGAEVTYSYTDANYSGDNSFLRGESDYTAHSTGLRYLHRFTPNSTGYVGYNYSTYNYDRIFPQDFNVHNGLVGLDHSFSPEYTVSASVGYFIRVNDLTDNQDGPTYTASLTRNFARGNITVGGNGGWAYENLQQGAGATSGFSEYYGGYVSGRYEILERVNIYAGLSYRHDKYTLDRTDYFRGNCGVRWEFLRYFYAALDYSYVDRSSDLGADEYTGNRIMLTLGASRLFQW